MENVYILRFSVKDKNGKTQRLDRAVVASNIREAYKQLDMYFDEFLFLLKRDFDIEPKDMDIKIFDNSTRHFRKEKE